MPEVVPDAALSAVAGDSPTESAVAAVLSGALVSAVAWSDDVAEDSVVDGVAADDGADPVDGVPAADVTTARRDHGVRRSTSAGAAEEDEAEDEDDDGGRGWDGGDGSR